MISVNAHAPVMSRRASGGATHTANHISPLLSVEALMTEVFSRALAVAYSRPSRVGVALNSTTRTSSQYNSFVVLYPARAEGHEVDDPAESSSPLVALTRRTTLLSTMTKSGCGCSVCGEAPAGAARVG